MRTFIALAGDDGQTLYINVDHIIAVTGNDEECEIEATEENTLTVDKGIKDIGRLLGQAAQIVGEV